MTIKFQKMIRWIPFFNLLPFFYGITVYCKKGNVYPFKSFFLTFCIIILIALPEIFIDTYVPIAWLQYVVGNICRYFHLFVIASYGIWLQADERE